MKLQKKMSKLEFSQKKLLNRKPKRRNKEELRQQNGSMKLINIYNWLKLNLLKNKRKRKKLNLN